MKQATPDEYKAVLSLLEADSSLKTFDEGLARVRGEDAPAAPKTSKYGAKKTVIDGITFASKMESDRYVQLKYLEKAGLIVNLELQPKFFFHINGQKLPRTWYQADFRYVDVETNEVVVEDVKGVVTSIYQLKKKLMKAVHGIEIREITRKDIKAA